MEAINKKKFEPAQGYFLGRLSENVESIGGFEKANYDEKTSEMLKVVKMGPPMDGYPVKFGEGARVLVDRLSGTVLVDKSKNKYLCMPQRAVKGYEQ